MSAASKVEVIEGISWGIQAISNYCQHKGATDVTKGGESDE